MARIRTVKPEFWGDEKLGPLSPIDRLVFLGLISMADDCGRVMNTAKVVDAFIFPYTDDISAPSLEILEELGRIQCGTTTSGQAVIQITNWGHQKIDKPNFKGALPAITNPSPAKRRRLPNEVSQGVWRLANAKCQSCGIACKGGKDDKYDRDPTLGEIDHILALADGGTDDPQNLQLLCLKCNRTKAGKALYERNRRWVGESSAITPRSVGATTYDLRPVPTTDDDDHGVPASVVTAAGIYLHDPTSRTARIGILRSLSQGMTGLPVSEAALVRGLEDMAVAGAEFRPVVVRSWCQRAVRLLEGEAGQRAAEASKSVLGHPRGNTTPSRGDAVGFAEDEVA